MSTDNPDIEEENSNNQAAAEESAISKEESPFGAESSKSELAKLSELTNR